MLVLPLTAGELGAYVVTDLSSVGLPEAEVEDRAFSSLVRPFAFAAVLRLPVVRLRLGVSHDISLSNEGFFVECVCENLYIKKVDREMCCGSIEVDRGGKDVKGQPKAIKDNQKQGILA